MYERRVAIIGGGISGLTAALTLTRHSHDVDVVVFERLRRVGGVIVSERHWGRITEGGPDTLMVKVPRVREWIHDLNLEPRQIFAREPQRPALRLTAAGFATGPVSTEGAVTFQDGMATLPRAMADGLGTSVWLDRTVWRIQPPRHTGHWMVDTSQGSEPFDAVVLATDAKSAACLLSPIEPEAAKLLTDIPYQARAVVSAIYRQEALSAMLREHSGFWCEPGAGAAMNACTVLTSKWNFGESSPYASLRTFWGSSEVPVHTWSDAVLLRRHQDELAFYTELIQPALFQRVFRWAHGLPEVDAALQESLGKMRQNLARTVPSLALVGAYMGGVGVASCVTYAEAEMQALLSRLSGAGCISAPPPPNHPSLFPTRDLHKTLVSRRS